MFDSTIDFLPFDWGALNRNELYEKPPPARV